MELQEVITSLNLKLQNNEKIKNIKYPKCLLKSLMELNSITGMEKLKNGIARQTTYIIHSQNNKNMTPPMLNTALYGPPGVGKTTVGNILAKVWSSIGILQKDIGRFEKYKIENGVKTEGQRNALYFTLFIFVMYILIVLISNIVEGKSQTLILEKKGIDTTFKTVANVILILTFVIGLLVYFWLEYKTSSKNYMKMWENDKIANVDLENVIDVVSRDDLVAGFVGHTAEKTRKVLARNIGKVLFIDEAYSLVHDKHDSFGIEALTTINLFLSQHPGKVIVILAGYENLIKKNLFENQPGLPRRFMWHFNLVEYTAEELIEIFISQLKERNFILANKEEATSIFKSNITDFPNYGGDTSKLIFYIEIEKSFTLERNVPSKKNLLLTRESESLFDNVVCGDDIKKALIELRSNTFQYKSNPLKISETETEKENLFNTFKNYFKDNDRVNTLPIEMEKDQK